MMGKKEPETITTTCMYKALEKSNEIMLILL